MTTQQRNKGKLLDLGQHCTVETSGALFGTLSPSSYRSRALPAPGGSATSEQHAIDVAHRKAESEVVDESGNVEMVPARAPEKQQIFVRWR